MTERRECSKREGHIGMACILDECSSTQRSSATVRGGSSWVGLDGQRECFDTRGVAFGPLGWVDLPILGVLRHLRSH